MKKLSSICLTAVFAAVSVFAAACSPDGSYVKFTKSCNIQGGEYVFEIPFEKEDCLYDISFFTRNDSASYWKGDYLKLEVRWISPGGIEAAETVYMPSSDRKGEAYPYRSGINPPEKGTWTLKLHPDPEEGISGLGVICKIADGTR